VWQRRVEVHSLGWCKLGRRELGTWIVVRVVKPMRSWVLTSLGSQVTLWNHPCGFIALARGVTLLLRFGIVVSTVWWNVLSLHPIGVIFHKDKSSLLWYQLHVYECISAIYLIII
jgi:hypothetical protein